MNEIIGKAKLLPMCEKTKLLHSSNYNSCIGIQLNILDGPFTDSQLSARARLKTTCIGPFYMVIDNNTKHNGYCCIHQLEMIPD